MCGRFAASASTDTYVDVFGIAEVVEEAQPSFNLAPTDPVPAVVERVDKESAQVVRKLVAPRWGLVPSWSKNARGGARLINARLETVHTKPAFRKAFATRRCLIPADGYYEWHDKRPWFITAGSGGLFVMAGLYEFWRDPAGPWLTTCTIITTGAVDSVGRIHDRMPVTLASGSWAAWLDPGLTDPDAARALLAAEPTPDLAAVEVSTRVNKVGNDGPDLVRPVN